MPLLRARPACRADALAAGPALPLRLHTRLQHLTDRCNHGAYCGEKCDGKGFTLEPEDELDQACRNHDWCLTEARKLGQEDRACVMCGCDQRLIDAAQEVRTPAGRRPRGAAAAAACISAGRWAGPKPPHRLHRPRPQIDRQGWAAGSYAKQAKEAWSIWEGITRGGSGGCPRVEGYVVSDERCVGIAGELAYPGAAADSSGAPADAEGATDATDATASSSTDEDASYETATDDGAASSSSCSAGVAADTDLTLGDLPGVEAVDVADWEECCAVCFENDDCWAW